MNFQDIISRLKTPVIMALGVLLLLFGAQGVRAEAAIADTTCLNCHDGQDKTLEATTHRLSSQTSDPAVTVACVSCHKGGEKHLDDPPPDNISNPGAMLRYDASLVCFDCHVAHVGLDNHGFDVHAEQDLNCSSCHKVHGGMQNLLLDDHAEFCTKCHRDVNMQFMRASNHPVGQGMLTCLDCHRLVTKEADDFAYDLQRICRDCHPRQAGPFPHEHAAVNAYAVNGEGCTECHNPHGSDNNFLLTRAGQHLCRQCHMTPPGHRLNSMHGSAFAEYDCVACHTDIHGSFVSDIFLDPNMPVNIGIGLSCFDCHDLIRGGK